MISAKRLGAMQPQASSAATLLHGSDLPKAVNVVVVRVTGVREAPPGFGSPVICDITPPAGVKELAGKVAFPLNKTNLGLCATLLDDDDMEHLVGKGLKLTRTVQNNPQTKTNTFGLTVTEVVK